jgi:hypothetical protein
MKAIVISARGAGGKWKRRRGKAHLSAFFQVTLVTLAATFTTHGATKMGLGKVCEREIAIMSRCATIGTVQESFKRPTERVIHGPVIEFFRGISAADRR